MTIRRIAPLSQDKAFRMKTLDFEIKSGVEDGCFCGYASVFNIVDSDKDVVMKGAFRNTINKTYYENKSFSTSNSLKEPEIALLWQHSFNHPIGKINTMHEDNNGLFVEATIFASSKHGEIAKKHIKSGAISGLSIGYVVRDSFIDKGNNVRYIKNLDLYEISVVSVPSNAYARIKNMKEKRYEDVLMSKREEKGAKEQKNEKGVKFLQSIKKLQDAVNNIEKALSL